MVGQCDTEVFKHGVSLGMFEMSKEDAEKYCLKQTQATGRKHDWHYSGGRVHIKALPPEHKRISDETLTQWAVRWDLQWTMTNLRECLEDARSLENS